MTPRARISEAQAILKALDLPISQQNRTFARTLLALCRLTVDKPWAHATRVGRTVTKGLMEFMRKEYSVRYAPNTRETIRRQVLHQFVLSGVADRNPFDPEIPYRE